MPVAALTHDRRERKIQGQQALAIADKVIGVSCAFDRYDLGMPPIADRLVAQGCASRQQPQPRPGLLRAQLAAQSEIHASRGLVDLAHKLGAEQFSLAQRGAPLRETYLDPAFARGEEPPCCPRNRSIAHRHQAAGGGHPEIDRGVRLQADL